MIFVRNAQFYWQTKCFIHALTFPLYHNDVAFSILSFVYLDFIARKKMNINWFEAVNTFL